MCLQTIRGGFALWNVRTLKSLAGLSALTEVRDAVTLEGLDALESLTGLVMPDVRSDLIIQHCHKLTNLTGLEVRARSECLVKLQQRRIDRWPVHHLVTSSRAFS